MWPYVEDDKKAEFAIYRVENPFAVSVQDCSAFSSNERIADFVVELQIDYVGKLERTKHQKAKFNESVNKLPPNVASSLHSTFQPRAQSNSRPNKPSIDRIPRKIEQKTTNYGSIHHKEDRNLFKRPDPPSYNVLSRAYQSKSTQQKSDWYSSQSDSKKPSPMSGLNFNRNSSKYPPSNFSSKSFADSRTSSRSSLFTPDNANVIGRNVSNLIDVFPKKDSKPTAVNLNDSRKREVPSTAINFGSADIRLQSPSIPSTFQNKVQLCDSRTNPIKKNTSSTSLDPSRADPRLHASIPTPITSIPTPIIQKDPRLVAPRTPITNGHQNGVLPPRGILKNGIKTSYEASSSVGQKSFSTTTALIDSAGLLPFQNLGGPRVPSISAYKEIENTFKKKSGGKNPREVIEVVDVECEKMPPAKRTQFSSPQVPKVLKKQQQAFASTLTSEEEMLTDGVDLSLDIESQIENDMIERRANENDRNNNDESKYDTGHQEGPELLRTIAELLRN